ncbi:unnamed protein product [Schistocephalus solidus]|uniref:Guanylate cyclase n=1 Tax=Schistocephalus solidus TaxID=70667 RepID=A0A183SFR7_SCHSO|nr:unnamed protein product [Schistocephalus solidus]
MYWIWTLSFAVALTASKLQLYIGNLEEGCWPEGSVFDTVDTIEAAIDYATSQTNGEITSNDIMYNLSYIPGCSMVEADHMYTVISFLRQARYLALFSAGYSVFVGPRLGSNCHFLSDWIALGANSTEAYRNLYQISYLCQDIEPFRHSALLPTSHTIDRTEATSFAVNIKDPTLIRSLDIFLRQNGWKNIVVLFEASPLVLKYSELARNLEIYLSGAVPGQEQLKVLTVHNLQSDSDPRGIVMRFCNPCQAIILLASPSITSYFIDIVSNMSIFENSETGIIQVDPSNAITYDALRLWRYILSTNGARGAAAQCTFVMTALPVDHGFDISSYILESKIQVSFASAVALAIRLAYVNFLDGGGVPPANTSFFAPLSEGFFSVPVLPNVSYEFYNHDGDSIEFYDFYFFTFTPSITTGATDVSALAFEEIFELNSVLLNPKQHLSNVKPKVWPNRSRHPQKDNCLTSPCFEDDVEDTMACTPPLENLGDCNIHLKRIDVPKATLKSKLLEYLRNLRSLRNENTNPFIGVYVDRESFYLVYEHCSRGSLKDVLAHPTLTLDEDFRLSLLNDLIKGMHYLHKSCLRLHGRLKSSNCVIDVRWVLKVTDFGVSKVENLYRIFRQDDPEELLWTAPEILRHPLEHPLGTQKGDVYSFAIVAHELFCHSPPFGDCDLTIPDILERIRSGNPVFRPKIEKDSIAPTIKNIIEISWSEIPEFRPTFEEIGKKFNEIENCREINLADHMLTLMQKYSAQLETEVQERTMELEEEKHKTEDLIAKMLPLSVAQALVTGNPVDPEAFESVTIYFSDIVGFSLISAKSTPLQIVNLLNDIYTTFDATIEKFDVYKVETIGDAYMVASGLPIRNGNLHAGEVATMALELLSLSGDLVIRHLPDVPILLRMGIHSAGNSQQHSTPLSANFFYSVSLTPWGPQVDVPILLRMGIHSAGSGQQHSTHLSAIFFYSVSLTPWGPQVDVAILLRMGIHSAGSGQQHSTPLSANFFHSLSLTPWGPQVDVPILLLGIHSGACVAGVIGLKMPRYCLFGDTVNTASRMESSSEGRRIHVSPSTKAILDELGGYHLSYRGRVHLKGRGEIDSYWLVGKDNFSRPLPEPLSSDGYSLMASKLANLPQPKVVNITEPNENPNNWSLQNSKCTGTKKQKLPDVNRWENTSGNQMADGRSQNHLIRKQSTQHIDSP